MNTGIDGGNRRHLNAHRLSLRSRLNQLQRLVGLLTRASTGASCLPGLLQWRTARTLGTYSGGAVPEFHRLPKHQTRDLYANKRSSVKAAPGKGRVKNLTHNRIPSGSAGDFAENQRGIATRMSWCFTAVSACGRAGCAPSGARSGRRTHRRQFLHLDQRPLTRLPLGLPARANRHIYVAAERRGDSHKSP